MPRIGAHAFLWIDEWTTEKGNQAIDRAAAAGCDFIEIPLLRPREFDAASHRKALRDAGIGATASLILPPNAHMPEEPERARQFLIEAMDQLGEVGGSYLCGCIAYHLGKLTGRPPTNVERQTVVETLRLVADDAKSRGITLGFECCNRYETYMYNVLADGREAITAIGADNIELHADTYHMNIEEEGFYKPLVESAGVLGYIHMSESHRGMVGTGTINWDEVFRGLADARYTGPLVLEAFVATNPDLAAATCMWRPSKYPPAIVVAEGLRFLREGAARAGLP
ncbi:MAG: sugar phosphate isomerase/epimerase [Actinobacteria bacterium]|nr:sugar phosphate isomerase/epimerase [Actinomycetota bacterium]